MIKSKLRFGARWAIAFVAFLPIASSICLSQQLNSASSFQSYAVAFLTTFSTVGIFFLLKNIRRRCKVSGRTVQIISVSKYSYDYDDYASYFITCLLACLTDFLLPGLGLIISFFLFLKFTRNITLAAFSSPIFRFKYSFNYLVYMDVESGVVGTAFCFSEAGTLGAVEYLSLEEIDHGFFYAQPRGLQ